MTLSGCCTSSQCLDKLSTADRDRVTAVGIKLGQVVNDHVSSPKQDRTDWKFVQLSSPGKLTVQLHWDDGHSALELGIFDIMGIKIQDGRAWGGGGKRAVVAVEQAGRYYIRIRAAGEDDDSQYALRVFFKADKTEPGPNCHHCTPSEKRCLGDDAVIECQVISSGCPSWTKVTPCSSNGTCKAGVCSNCPNACTIGERKCHGRGFSVCIKGPDNCGVWSKIRWCTRDKRCSNGECIKASAQTPQVISPPTPPPPAKAKTAKARILTIYTLRGEPTLHLDIKNNPEVRVGQEGTVLIGDSDKPLPGGKIKIIKVLRGYAIASTTLKSIGKNVWVSIQIK